MEESGVDHARALAAFADAAVQGSATEIDETREVLVAAIGFPAMVDAAGVIGNFQRMNRIADGTGLELDAPMRALTGEVGETLGLRKFASAENTKQTGITVRVLGKLIYPLVVRFLKPPSATK